MTDIERAIKHFENVRDGAMVVLDSFGHKPNENPSLYKRRKLNAELAISALEKQIPKKPIVHLEKNYEGDICDASYSCPICSRTICFEVEGNLAENYPYCHCGYKLDWGDGE